MQPHQGDGRRRMAILAEFEERDDCPLILAEITRGQTGAGERHLPPRKTHGPAVWIGLRREHAASKRTRKPEGNRRLPYLKHFQLAPPSLALFRSRNEIPPGKAIH